MSQHVEWVSAHDYGMNYEFFRDAHGSTSDGPALLIGTDSTVAIEGTREQILELLARATEIVKTAPPSYWVIGKASDDRWLWSRRRQGWVEDPAEAGVYSEDERRNMELPNRGRWIFFDDDNEELPYLVGDFTEGTGNEEVAVLLADFEIVKIEFDRLRDSTITNDLAAWYEQVFEVYAKLAQMKETARTIPDVPTEDAQRLDHLLQRINADMRTIERDAFGLQEDQS